jgi:hypothetical protein
LRLRTAARELGGDARGGSDQRTAPIPDSTWCRKKSPDLSAGAPQSDGRYHQSDGQLWPPRTVQADGPRQGCRMPRCPLRLQHRAASRLVIAGQTIAISGHAWRWPPPRPGRSWCRWRDDQRFRPRPFASLTRLLPCCALFSCVKRIEPWIKAVCSCLRSSTASH